MKNKKKKQKNKNILFTEKKNKVYKVTFINFLNEQN